MQKTGKPMNIIVDNLFPMADQETKDEILRRACIYEHEETTLFW